MATVLLESRPYRPFKSSEEYLYAMREDLAEWLNTLYPELRINVDNFMDRLDTGVALCKHANNVRNAAEEYLARRQARQKSMTKSMTTGIAGPILSMGNVHFLPAAKSGTFFARDNVSNFITWCRKSLHIFECLLFETDDLIMRKNEKHVILCLLEVARIGARFGMEAPMLVQMERQIDREIAADNKAMGISVSTETDKMSHSISVGTDGNNLFDSDSEDEDNIDEKPLLVYGPQPQIITNDLKSLDEMVRDLVERCTCPSQFPMVRVSEGKYRIGDTKVLIFVRILRSHVMVRVGGGWDTLSHYLDKHDPCRCRSAHRSSVAARIMTRTNPSTNGIELHKAQVFYERSPPVTRKSLPAAANAPKSTLHNPTASSAGHVNNGNSLSPPMLGRSRSRSPTSTRRAMFSTASSNHNHSAESGPSSLDASFSFRRSVSPRARMSPQKKITINEPTMNSLLTVTSTVDEIIPEVVPTPIQAAAATNHTANNGTVADATKFENISDNGSEISDEGYRSLGLIQNGQAVGGHGHTANGVEKRTSIHSQLSTDDADYSVRLESESSADSSQPTAPGSDAGTPTQMCSSKSMDLMMDPIDEKDLVMMPPQDDNFAKSGILINEDRISVDIANATGLRQTDFSTLYDEKKRMSRIPRSPLPTVRSRRNSTENLTITETRAESPATCLSARRSPQYSSINRKSIPKPVATANPTNGKNTWNGRDSNPTTMGSVSGGRKQRPALARDTFQLPSNSNFSRNSPVRASYQGNGSNYSQYDSNGRRIQNSRSGTKSNSVQTSPSKQSLAGATSPLAQQLLEAAENAKSDTQILEKMKELLKEYSNKDSNKSRRQSPGLQPAEQLEEFEDFTAAWVNSNGLDRTSNASTPTSTSTLQKKGSTYSLNDSGVSGTPRRVSKIPSLRQNNTELY